MGKECQNTDFLSLTPRNFTAANRLNGSNIKGSL